MLRSLALRDYRNFAQAEIEFGPRFTVLVGRNGTGKTNVLEAIYLLSTLRSFRVSELGPLVREGTAGARVQAETDDEVAGVPSRLVVRVERRHNSTRRTAEVDGKIVRRASDFYGRVRAILFTPEDLSVIRGGPLARRQLVDRMLFACDRTHITDTQAYDKVVRSRNQILKQSLSSGDCAPLLDSYDQQVVELGERIWSRRADLLTALTPLFHAAFEQIHGIGSTAELAYMSRLESREGSIPPQGRTRAIQDALERRRRDDLARGVTTVGPHRDDVSITVGGHAAATHASQGQTRALVLALKLAELRAAREREGVAPLLLLDDVSSELDTERSTQLFSALTADAGQCLITTTEMRLASLAADADTRRFDVSDGVLNMCAAID